MSSGICPSCGKAEREAKDKERAERDDEEDFLHEFADRLGVEKDDLDRLLEIARRR